MDPTVDYYAILGVLPTAENVVLRAAYKALAQRYHPDRFEGVADDAVRLMQEINEAYAVLSDPVQRDKYDKLRGSSTQSAGWYFRENTNDVAPRYDPLEKEWAVAVKYYPDLPQTEARLSGIAWRLGYSFRAHMLNAKAFENRAQVAESMERRFLELYFGTNKRIVDFAQELISGGHKNAARALNEAVLVLGNDVDSARVINRIRSDLISASPSPVVAYTNYNPITRSSS